MPGSKRAGNSAPLRIPWKMLDRVQVRGLPAGVASPGCRRTAQLAALRSIRSIAQKIEAEQRMIVEHSVGGANHGLAIAFRVPRQPDARLNVVGIGLDAFLQSQHVVSGQAPAVGRSELGRELDVVAKAVVQGQVGPRPPGILPEDSQGFVGEGVVRVANALHEVVWESRVRRPAPGKIRERAAASSEAGNCTRSHPAPGSLRRQSRRRRRSSR